MYPEYAEINGRQYKLDTDFNTALKCFEIIDDKSITDYERALAIIYLLFDFVPTKNLDLFLDKARIFLQCGIENVESNCQPDMDFVQDRKYISASFMSDYHIDLSKEKLHFWQFVEYLEGLTENSALFRLRNLRNFDLSEIKDDKERSKYAEMQKKVELKKKKVLLNDNQSKSIASFCEAMGIRKENES